MVHHVACLLAGPEEGGPGRLQPAGHPDQGPAEGSHLPPQSALPGQHIHTLIELILLFILNFKMISVKFYLLNEMAIVLKTPCLSFLPGETMGN